MKKNLGARFNDEKSYVCCKFFCIVFWLIKKAVSKCGLTVLSFKCVYHIQWIWVNDEEENVRLVCLARFQFIQNKNAFDLIGFFLKN